MRIILILSAALLVASCSNVGDKTKKALNKTGEAIGEGSAEFAKGISEGVDNTLGSEVVVSDSLKARGIALGKFKIEKDSASAFRNKLQAYIIFGADFNGDITVKVFDNRGKEYGRVAAHLTAKKGDAHYESFIFDRRTDIESKSRFILE